MRSIKPGTIRHVVSYFVILAVVFCAIMLVPMRLRARADGTAISVTNNSSRRMVHLYLSPPNSDKWGADELDDAVMIPGDAFTLSNVDCPASSIKVVAEDQDGCFVSVVVACSENASWSITNDLTPDCGN
jgi:hypothetical protein